MYKKTLILTYSEDRHADAVIEQLQKRKVDVFRVNTEYLIKDYQIRFDLQTRLFYLSDGKRKEAIDESWAIWNRRVSDPQIPEMTPDLQQIVYEETTRTWDGLLFSAKGKVVNRPQAQYSANNKIAQLLFAREHGIKTPETIVTNIPQEAIDFFDRNKKDDRRTCHKLQKVAIVTKGNEDLVTYTNIVNEDALRNVELIRTHPNVFQTYIDKQFEVRVTGFEDHAVGIAIHSQDSELSKVDFRKYDFDNVRYEKIDLPRKIEDFCIEMLKKHDLSFGEFDFIYDKNGAYVFLELNPNGQWLWLQLMSGFDLVTPFVDNLLNKTCQ